MNTQKQATPDHPVHELVAKRWSPYAFADRPVPEEDLRSLFEAARWSASSYNEQPWRYVVATKAADSAEFDRLLSCLVEGNQAWAKAAPVLALGCTSLNFARNGKPNAAAVHDLGLTATLTVEATARGLSVHQMIGILPEKARELYRIPEGVQPLTGLAIGYAADPNILPEQLRVRDLTARTRKPLSEFVFGGEWGAASGLVK